jgi:hypothetical protein
MDEVLSNLRNVFQQEKHETQGDLIEKDVMLTIETLPGVTSTGFLQCSLERHCKEQRSDVQVSSVPSFGKAHHCHFVFFQNQPTLR